MISSASPQWFCHGRFSSWSSSAPVGLHSGNKESPRRCWFWQWCHRWHHNALSAGEGTRTGFPAACSSRSWPQRSLWFPNPCQRSPTCHRSEKPRMPWPNPFSKLAFCCFGCLPSKTMLPTIVIANFACKERIGSCFRKILCQCQLSPHRLQLRIEGCERHLWTNQQFCVRRNFCGLHSNPI